MPVSKDCNQGQGLCRWEEGDPRAPGTRRETASVRVVPGGGRPGGSGDACAYAGRGSIAFQATRPATAAAWAGFTRTAPANSEPKSAGTTSTFFPGSGAWIIHPLPT